MRKIDKYISKEKMCNLVANRAEKLFELSSEESNYLRNRLKKYDKIYPVLDVPFQKHHVMN